jgi:integrase
MRKSYKTVSSALKHVENYFGRGMSISTITNREVHEFVSHELSKGIAPATVNRHLSALKVLIKHARIMGYTPEVIEISQLKESNRRTLTVTRDEYESIREQLAGDECNRDIRDIFTVLYETGLRLAELLRIEPNDINFAKGKFGVLLIKLSKNGKPRVIPLTEAVSVVLRKRLADSDGELLFSFSKGEIYVKWKTMKDSLKGLERLTENREFVPHILRHSCITNLAIQGVPLAHIQQWAGHTTIATTARYTHLTDSQLEQYV